MAGKAAKIAESPAFKPARFVVVGIGLFLTLLGIAVLFSSFVDDLLLSLGAFLKGAPLAPGWPAHLSNLGGDALLSGVAIIVFGWLLLPREALVISLAQKQYFLSVAAALVVSVFWIPVVIATHSTMIVGERYWWLTDDAMISMRYARNLANGIGLVWNPGERIEGFTNFLWTIFMALVHLFPIPDSQTSLVVLIVSFILVIATIPVIIRIVRILGGGTLATIATLAGYAFSESMMYWQTSGLETPLLTFLFLVSTWRVLHESATNEPRPLTYVLLIGIMPLVRMDAIVLAALLLGVSLLLNKKRKEVLVYSAISLLLPTANEIFRIYYFGDILPNTAYLKTMSWPGRYRAGLTYVLDFVKSYALLVVLAVIGTIRCRQRPHYALFVALVLYAVYVVYVGGDGAFVAFRFFVPILPLLMALAFIGIQDLWSGRGWRLALSTLCLIALPLIIPGYTSYVFPSSDDTDRLLQEYNLATINIPIGLLLKQNTPPTSKVADFWGGSPYYFSERYGVDLLGKSDRHIAQLPVTPTSGTLPGHNKFDYQYSLGELKPDFVAASFSWSVTEPDLRRAATGDYPYAGQLYFDPVFQEHCLPYPVDTVHTGRIIFVCDWSDQLQTRDEWKDLSSYSSLR